VLCWTVYNSYNLLFSVREIHVRCPEEVAACHHAVNEVSLNVALTALLIISFVFWNPLQYDGDA
jgi:hypothetical protein